MTCEAAVAEALRQCPLVLSDAAAGGPAARLRRLGAHCSRIWFWIGDYALELEARDQVRTSIWYAFRREEHRDPVADSD